MVRETVYVWWRTRLRSATLRSDHAEQDCSARLRRGLGRSAPRSRGAARAAVPTRRRMQQPGGRARSLCPHASGWTRAQRALVGGDLTLIEPEAVEEAVHVDVVLRLHARRGNRRRIRVRLLLP